MADEKILTPEQEQELASLTDEERAQLASLVGPNGEVSEESLASVSGGKISPKVKKILGWGAAAVGGAAALAAAVLLGKNVYDKKNAGTPPATPPGKQPAAPIATAAGNPLDPA